MCWLGKKVVLLGALSFLIMSSSAKADEPIQIPEIIDSDLVLISGQTYYINRDTTVVEGVELAIQPGAVLKMCQRGGGIRSILSIRGHLRAEGLPANVIRFASGDDDSIGQIVGCSGSGIIEFDSNEASTVRHMQVSRGIFRVSGTSPVDFSDVRFEPTVDFDWAITGVLAPNITAENVTFSSRVSRAGYFVNNRIARPDDVMPNINMPYLIDGSVEVPGDASLRIEADVVIKMSGSFQIYGKLEVAGAVAEEVVFSGPTDNRYGGAVNAGFTGRFTGIHFYPQAHSSSVRHAIMADEASSLPSSTAMFIFDGANPYIENVLIEAQLRNTASGNAMMRVRQEAQPTINCLALRSTSTTAWAALLNANVVSTVTATDVYWDSPVGPTVSSEETLGARVWGSANVLPFRTSVTGPCSIDPPSSLLLDVDGDGQANPVIDGLLISRYMAGMRGEDLLQGLVVPQGAARRSPAEIETYLDWMITRSAR